MDPLEIACAAIIISSATKKRVKRKRRMKEWLKKHNTDMKNMDFSIEENDEEVRTIAERNGQIEEKFDHIDIAYRNSDANNTHSYNNVKNIELNGDNSNPVLEKNCMLFIEDDVLAEKLNKQKNLIDKSSSIENEKNGIKTNESGLDVGIDMDIKDNILNLDFEESSEHYENDKSIVKNEKIKLEISNELNEEDQPNELDANRKSEKDESKEDSEKTELEKCSKTSEKDESKEECVNTNEKFQSKEDSENIGLDESTKTSKKDDIKIIKLEENDKSSEKGEIQNNHESIDLEVNQNDVSNKSEKIVFKENNKDMEKDKPTENELMDIEENNKNDEKKLTPPQADNPPNSQVISLPDDDDDDLVIVETESNQNKEKENLPAAINTEGPTNIETGSKTSSESADEAPVKEKELDLKPLQFMNIFKDHFEKMTRDNLEEFCLIKFAEAIDSKCELSKAVSEIQTLNNNLEEWRKKVVALTKQNKDLQIVIKTMAEQLKKPNFDHPIPIRITRSVGLQVGAPNVNKKSSSVISSSSDTSDSKRAKSRLAPKDQAVRRPDQSNLKAPKTPAPRPSPQSFKPSSADKRSSQQTIDLTDDDERPAKQPKLNSNKSIVPVHNKPQPKQYSNNKSTSKPFLPPVGPKQVFVAVTNQRKQGFSPNGVIMTKNSPPPLLQISSPNQKIQKISQSPIRIAPKKIPTHPATLPAPPRIQVFQDGWKMIPPRPSLKIMKVDNGIVISWEMEDFSALKHEEVASYQIYAYQQTASSPSTELWKKIGEVKALPLPMACTLTHFMSGYKYFFAIRALDVKTRVGSFSQPEEISLI